MSAATICQKRFPEQDSFVQITQCHKSTCFATEIYHSMKPPLYFTALSKNAQICRYKEPAKTRDPIQWC